MNIFKNLIPEKDKLLHFIAGTYMSLFFQIFIPYLWALGLVAIIAIGKELIYDMYFKKGTPEIADGIATFLGGFLALWLSHVVIPIF